MRWRVIKTWQIPEGKVKSVSTNGAVLWQSKTQAEQLTAPTISLDGDTLTMTATDERTEEFAIFVDGVEMATVQTLISFMIEGTTYQAVEGMTWGEWVESAFNTGNYFVENNYIKTGVTYVYLYGVGSIAPTAKILANTEYELRAGGGSN